MYMPYLRGRRSELLALRDLSSAGKLSHVVPVVEPVKADGALLKTLEEMTKRGNDVVLISNPVVGDFAKELKGNQEFREKFENLLASQYITPGYIVNGDPTSIPEEETKKSVLILHEGGEAKYIALTQNAKPLLTLTADNANLLTVVKGNKALLADHFHAKQRNADYTTSPEFFSRDHLTYKDKKRGFQAFSDYSIVGNSFSTDGFLPHAIVLHIIFLDDNDELNIHHFLSNSNSDFKDQARKYGEAVKKLLKWVESDDSIYRTEGLKKFINSAHAGNFPGLGSIKRNSIAHHIELMDAYLGGRVGNVPTTAS